MIDADRFHSAFAAGFERQFQGGRALERSGDKRPCWTTRVAGRLFVIAFPLDSGAHAPPFGPSLFHDHFVWHGPVGGEGTVDFVDHANEAERQQLRRLQDLAYAKAERACDAEAPLWRDLGRAYLAPVRQMIESGARLDDHHLFVCADEDDARVWGDWFGSTMEGWMTRFEAWHGVPAKKADKAA